MSALYGGFFALDLRLLLLTMLVAVLGALGTVLAVRRLRWGRGLVPWIFVFFLGYFILLAVIFDVAVGYPVFVIRSFFEIP